jgi:predicted MPP superfamily phosphohydrolase
VNSERHGGAPGKDVLRVPKTTDTDDPEGAALSALEQRLGHLHVRQRLGLERDYEAHVFRKGTHFFHIENWYSIHGLIRGTLRITGLHARGRRNALRIELRHNEVSIPHLPEAFDSLVLLQLSDLHFGMSGGFLEALVDRIAGLQYDLCVLTGDYRARTFGPFDAALAGLKQLRPHLVGTVYAVLGNHDTIRMVPAMEEMGYRLLLNEWVKVQREGETLYLAGIEDAHFYRLENYHRAAQDSPLEAASILLSHTPEAYRHAAHAGFDLMLCGHTHGGQICLPAGIPILTDADSPRRLVRGAWRHHDMLGYTSAGAGTCIVDVRLNCPPEVTLHRLHRRPR